MATLRKSDKSYDHIVEAIEAGKIKIPRFQQGFVWNLQQAADLIDSILNEYPIGTFIYWRTNEVLRAVRNIGDIDLPDTSNREYVTYVLDGQQRITSLFASIKGAKVPKKDTKGKFHDFSNIYIDLDPKEGDDIAITDVKGKIPYTYVPIQELMDGSYESDNFTGANRKKIEKHKRILYGYQFTGVELEEAPIEVATDVFTRLNTGGKALKPFEIMVAKTYDRKLDFDLGVKYAALMKELHNYGSIPPATILQLIAILIEKKEPKKRVILGLNKKAFIAEWDGVVEAIRGTIDFLRPRGVPLSELLPYPALIVAFSYFFYKSRNNPTGDQIKLLEDFFWRVAIGDRYASSTESKLWNDIQKIDEILKGEQPEYDWKVDYSPEFIKENGNFKKDSPFIKAILCLYTLKRPRDFVGDQEVQVDKGNLKKSNTPNYHHFFPKNYIETHLPHEEERADHIANITIINEDTNNRIIQAKAPATYMKTFEGENSNLAATMKTHLIDVDSFGIWENDYDTFFNARAEAISKALGERILPPKSSETTA